MDETTWVQLSAGEAETLYRVGADTAADPSYAFYESSARRRSTGDDGPWSLVALALTSDLATVRIANVEEEQLEWDGYDPLEYAPGFLLLKRSEVDALAELITATARRLGEPPEDGPRFAAVEGDAVDELGLGDEVFEGHRQSFHLARAPGDGEAPGAVVFFSSIDPQPADLLFIGIRELATPDEGDGSRANPDAPARVTLDRRGLEELAALLADEAEHLAGP